jgi:RNA polymerase sigma-70 factor, ECF subfamily
MERQAFEKLALEHVDAVYRMSLHLTRNPDTAQDLAQEVFARAFKPEAIERFEDRQGSEGVRAWLFTICHNAFYSQAKRAARAPQSVGEVFDAQDTEPGPDEPPPAWNGKNLNWEHVDERLKAAIDDLSDEFREILLLWGVEGFKYREIAAILGIPIGTVMSRLHRARKVLADRLLSDEQATSELGLTARQAARDRESA